MQHQVSKEAEIIMFSNIPKKKIVDSRFDGHKVWFNTKFLHQIMTLPNLPLKQLKGVN